MKMGINKISLQEFPASDLDYCTIADRFDFALQVERRNSLNILKLG
jgi:hypothetical protein